MHGVCVCTLEKMKMRVSAEEEGGDNYKELKHLTVAYYALYRTIVNFYSEFTSTVCFPLIFLKVG